jgi:hypothetical protein
MKPINNLSKFFVGTIIALLSMGFLTSCKSSEEISTRIEPIKIITASPGIYQLSLADIGWTAMNPKRISLTSRDQPVPIWFESNGDDGSLYFYAPVPNSIYSAENIFILHPNSSGAARVSQRDLEDAQKVDSSLGIAAVVRMEENSLYTPLVIAGDHWFAEKLISPQKIAVEMDLVDVTSGAGLLSAVFWGNTTMPVDPDHHVRLWVNGHEIGEQTWDGQTWQTVTAEIPPGVLQTGGNTVEIDLTGETDAVIDIVYLDSLELAYDRLPNLNERFSFQATQTRLLEIPNLAVENLIFDISTPENISVARVAPQTSVIQVEAGHQYVSTPIGKALTPKMETAAILSPNLSAATPGAEYIVIASDLFLPALEPLLKWRQEQGLTVLSLIPQTIYDQFNAGYPEPDGIQKFLSYAVENWQIPPKYVLLVGDASYDFKGHITPPDESFIPTEMVSSSFGGQTGSDIPLSNLNDDPWPEVAIGRIPARSAAQVKSLVNKIISFEQNPISLDENPHILAVSDGQEAHFRSEAQTFLDLFSAPYQTELIATEAGDIEAANQIGTAIKNDNFITAYFGHGSINMWGKDRLFTRENSQELENDRYPIMLHMTCLTGLFFHPTEESLVENLLWNPNGGAVAILGPTSLTLASAQNHLTGAFAEYLTQNPTARLGDVALHAWRQVPTSSQDQIDVMNTFLLFGDPALRLMGNSD